MNQLNNYLKLFDDLQPYICCFIDYNHFSIQYAGMYRTKRKSEVSPSENCISKGLAQGSRTLNSTLPFKRLAGPLIIRQVKMKSYLSIAKIVSDD